MPLGRKPFPDPRLPVSAALRTMMAAGLRMCPGEGSWAYAFPFLPLFWLDRSALRCGTCVIAVTRCPL